MGRFGPVQMGNKPYIISHLTSDPTAAVMAINQPHQFGGLDVAQAMLITADMVHIL